MTFRKIESYDEISNMLRRLSYHFDSTAQEVELDLICMMIQKNVILFTLFLFHITQDWKRNFPQYVNKIL